jgi:hypothetical protein
MSAIRNVGMHVSLFVLAGALCALLPDAASAAYPIAFGGNGEDNVEHTIVGASGDLYVAGSFSGNLSVVVGSNTRVLSAMPDSQGNDVFVARLNPAGQAVWIAGLGGLGDDTVDALTLDADGNVFVAGLFTGQADFGSASLTASSGGPDGYVARLDAAGTNGSGAVTWARRFGLSPNSPAVRISTACRRWWRCRGAAASSAAASCWSAVQRAMRSSPATPRR